MVATTARNPKDRLESVQVLRGIAALLVVLVHAVQRQDRLDNPAELLASFSYAGSIGVDLFFVISGFVMALSMQRYEGGGGALRFIGQRFYRIAPIFYFWCACFAIVLVLQGWEIGTKQLLNSVTFLPVFDTGGYAAPILGVGWTLAFEATFYVIVCAVILMRLPPWTLIPIIVGLTLVPALDQSELVAVRFFFNSILLEFALGVAAYVLWSKNRLRPSLVFAGAIGGLIVIFLLLPERTDPLYRSAPIFNNSLSALRALVWGVPCFCLFLAVLKWRPGAGRVTDAFKLLGDASYSIYLTHQIVLFAAFGTFLPGDLEAVLMLVASALFGIGAYLLVERPLMQHKPGEFFRTRFQSAR